MATLEFPFLKLHKDDVPRPWLPIVIENPHTDPPKIIRTYGLIDTGADECAIPAGYASLLGHDLQAGKQKTINTGNGPTVAYSHTLCIDVQGIRSDNVLIDFMPNLSVILIGVKNFLEEFILTVDYPKNTFSLRNPL
jgi:hypothetical protein